MIIWILLNSRRKNIGAPKIQNDCQFPIAILDFALLLPIRLSLFKLSFNHQSINKFDSTKIISHFGCTNNIFLKCMYNFTTQNFINKSLSQHKQNKTQLINIKPTIRILTLLLYNFHTKDKNNKLIYFFLMFRSLHVRKYTLIQIIITEKSEICIYIDIFVPINFKPLKIII